MKISLVRRAMENSREGEVEHAVTWGELFKILNLEDSIILHSKNSKRITRLDEKSQNRVSLREIRRSGRFNDLLRSEKVQHLFRQGYGAAALAVGAADDSSDATV